MVVYIEYAFVWNFLLDATLLWLALRASKTPVRWGKLCLAAVCGATFALLFPLMRLSTFWAYILKFCVGFLLCLTVAPPIKNKKAGGRYAFICLFFFCFTFAFGGVLTAIGGEEMGKGILLAVFALLSAITLFFVAKLYEKRVVEKCVYNCAIVYKQRHTATLAFYDSGNLASKNGTPVCFVSPDLAYDVWGDELAFANSEDGGQVCDEMQIQTLGGVKKVRLFCAGLEIVTKEGIFRAEKVYFSPSANMLSREYKLLLNSRIFEEKQEKEGGKK